MVTRETKRREKLSQSISPPFSEGEVCWLHFSAPPVHNSSVSRKAAKEKAAISIKNRVNARKALYVGLAFLMALVLGMRRR